MIKIIVIVEIMINIMIVITIMIIIIIVTKLNRTGNSVFISHFTFYVSQLLCRV